jgi:hypothetical protein
MVRPSSALAFSGMKSCMEKHSKAIFPKVSLQVDQLTKQNYFPIVPKIFSFIQYKKHNFKCCYIRPNPGGESHVAVIASPVIKWVIV